MIADEMRCPRCGKKCEWELGGCLQLMSSCECGILIDPDVMDAWHAAQNKVVGSLRHYNHNALADEVEKVYRQAKKYRKAKKAAKRLKERAEELEEHCLLRERRISELEEAIRVHRDSLGGDSVFGGDHDLWRVAGILDEEE